MRLLPKYTQENQDKSVEIEIAVSFPHINRILHDEPIDEKKIMRCDMQKNPKTSHQPWTEWRSEVVKVS